MSASTNAERIRDGYRAFNAGDGPALVDLFDPEIVWHFPGTSKFAGDYVGRDATLTMLGGFAQGSGGTFHAEMHEVTASDGYAIGWARDTARRDGKELDVSATVVFRMDGGRVVEAWHHFDDTARVDAFWA